MEQRSVLLLAVDFIDNVESLYNDVARITKYYISDGVVIVLILMENQCYVDEIYQKFGNVCSGVQSLDRDYLIYKAEYRITGCQ